MRRTIAISVALFCLGLPVLPANANVAAAAPRLQTSGGFTAPVGFQIFCLQSPSFCKGGGKSEIALTDDAISVLQSVNGTINRAIRPRNERQDVWALGVTSGDCEDYVLAKRAKLIEAGFPASALRIAAVNTREGEGHAVLVVRTNAGDVVLDNLTSKLKFADQTGYSWVAMTESNGRSWKKVS